ncbi:hypothetical protein [Pyrobaculum sp.]|uniref:hypothetical protein n=1 Tax=Pyrobaculum sp. TaxID=2004705 RepID=UPI003D12B1A4
MAGDEAAVRRWVIDMLKFAMALELASGLVSLYYIFAVAGALVYVLTYFLGAVAGAAAAVAAATYIALGYSTVFAAYRIVKKPTALKPGEALLWSKLALVAAVLAVLSANILYSITSGLMALSLYLYTRELARLTQEKILK